MRQDARKLSKQLKRANTFLLILTIIVIVYVMSLLKSLLIPFTVALFLALLLQPFFTWFHKKKIPFFISLIVVLIGGGLLFFLLWQLISQTAGQIQDQQQELIAQFKSKLAPMITFLNETFNLDVAMNGKDLPKKLKDVVPLSSIASFSTSFAGATIDVAMTFVFLILMANSVARYAEYIRYVSGDEMQEKKLLKNFREIKQGMATYIRVKFIVSLMTGATLGVICWLFGVSFAIFWGALAFLLNFIPSIGSIAATIPPVLLSFVQLDSWWIILAFAVLLFLTQFAFGNLIEPRMQGSELSINTVFVILGLLFWGYIWGVVGMLLSVPLLVFVKVVLSQYDDAGFIVRLMSAPPKNKASGGGADEQS